MSLAISAIRTSAATPTGVAPDTDVALRANLAKCQRQLGDWEGCSSSKTPEGKKIIDALRAQIGNLQSRLSAPSGGTQPPATATATTPTTPTVARAGLPRLLDVYA